MLRLLEHIYRHEGKVLRKDITSQTFYDENMDAHVVRPGQFVSHEMIRRLHIPDRYFVHPDSMRTRGAFDFAAKKKGKFSILIIRDYFGRGDVLLASVIAKALKHKYGKNVSVWYVVKPEYRDLLLYNPWIDKVFVSREKGLDAKPDINISVNDLEFRVELKDFERDGRIIKNRTSIYLEQLGLQLENRTPTYRVSMDERKWAKKELKRLGLQ